MIFCNVFCFSQAVSILVIYSFVDVSQNALHFCSWVTGLTSKADFGSRHTSVKLPKLADVEDQVSALSFVKIIKEFEQVEY